MRSLVLSFVLISFVFTGCGPKAGPDVTPHGQAVLKADKVIVALTEFQDGISAAFYSEYLGAQQTVLIAQSLSVAVNAIHSSPEGALKTAIELVADLRKKLNAFPDAVKYGPYLDSLSIVLGAL